MINKDPGCLNYSLLKKPVAIIVSSCLVVLTYQGLYYLHPANQDWIGSSGFSWTNTLQFIFIDQILIECITFTIVFAALRWYGNYRQLFEPGATFREQFLYFLRFMPTLLVVYFLFAPITLTVRHFYHYFPDFNWEAYWNEYFFLKKELYLVYLLPVFLGGYGILTVNFLLARPNSEAGSPARQAPPDVLFVKDQLGELPVPLADIWWIERSDRKYLVQTKNSKYQINKTLSELDAILIGRLFARINRSVIINLHYLDNYAFWENGKYALRMQDGTTFTMTRSRFKKLKEKFDMH